MPTIAQLRAAIEAPVTRVISQVDVYENDSETLWDGMAPYVDGTVGVDSTRAERRTLDIEFSNANNKYDSYPGGFWYDKVIKPYRGVVLEDGTRWMVQLGEFIIDSIEEQDFPYRVKVSCRDQAKKLSQSKFAKSTGFEKGALVEDTIKTIAQVAGVTKFRLPNQGKVMGRDFVWERGTERGAAITDLAGAYNYEWFFDNEGYLVLDEPPDPAADAPVYTFRAGIHTKAYERPTPYSTEEEKLNVESWTKSTNDSRLYNHVVVTGESADNTVLPVSAEAINDNPFSPTNIDEIGDRLFEYTSGFITTQDQAQAVADSFLAMHSLEEFEINLSTIVVPWLDAGQIVEFIDPRPNPGDPSRFLLSTFSIPLNLGKMNPVGKRVTVVG